MDTIDARPARTCPRCQRGRLVRTSLLGRRLRCDACARGFEFDPHATAPTPAAPPKSRHYWTYGALGMTVAVAAIVAAVVLTRPARVVVDGSRSAPVPTPAPTPRSPAPAPAALPSRPASRPAASAPGAPAPRATPAPRQNEEPRTPRRVDPTSPIVTTRPAARPAPPGRQRPAAVESADYVLLPLEGMVGAHVTADLVEQAVDHAARQPGRTLVLRITSNGGYTEEMHRITAALLRARQSRGVRVVALVHERALSAAAILALACREVYMTPGATIGAALAVVNEGGRQTAVEEKYASVERARARVAAEAAGHEGAVVDAMMNPDVALSWAVRRDGSVAILRGAPSQYAAQREAYSEGPFVLCDRGQILSLTASEAVKLGVADGVAADVEALGALLNVNRWRAADGYGRQLAAGRAQAVRRVEHEYESLVKDVRRLGEAMVRVPRWDQVRLDGHDRTLRERVDRLRTLAAEHPWIADRLRQEFNQ